MACACSEKNEQALAEFHRTYVPQARRALNRAGFDCGLREDAIQELLLNLFLGTATNPPKIGEYRGSGTLASWVRIAAIRTALNLRPRVVDSANVDTTSRAPAAAQSTFATSDPELELFRTEYRPEFERAVRDALVVMRDRDLYVLRRHYIAGDGLSQIARDHAVTHTSVARWLLRAKTVLFGEVRRLLAERLRLSGSEINSLGAKLKSLLDTSCAAPLRDALGR